VTVVVVVCDDEIEVTVEAEVDVNKEPVVEGVADELELWIGPEAYMLSRLGPPQYSVWLLLHVMLQSDAVALTEPAPRLLPQKHCPPYSTPEYL
jgi:hypothetical protein